MVSDNSDLIIALLVVILMPLGLPLFIALTNVKQPERHRGDEDTND